MDLSTFLTLAGCKRFSHACPAICGTRCPAPPPVQSPSALCTTQTCATTGERAEAAASAGRAVSALLAMQSWPSLSGPEPPGNASECWTEYPARLNQPTGAPSTICCRCAEALRWTCGARSRHAASRSHQVCPLCPLCLLWLASRLRMDQQPPLRQAAGGGSLLLCVTPAISWSLPQRVHTHRVTHAA